jgi:3-methyl-2-oxobutanoate hydroxymethyltransferase
MRLTIQELGEMKRRGESIPMITAYDYTAARLVEQAGLRLVLVGDSLGQCVLGYDSTVPVTMDDIVSHTKAVVRGSGKSHVVADMPFMSYQSDVQTAVRNAGRMLSEAGAQSVKLEGGRKVADTVNRIVDAGVPVMGHIGLTPQSIHQLGGYSIQGKTLESARKLLNDALALENSGAYAIVLELIPSKLAGIITQQLSIPTIGIGSGPECDGQVQVFHDLLGLLPNFRPKHARRYADLDSAIVKAVSDYIQDVRVGSFPDSNESYSINEIIYENLLDETTV